MTAQPREAVTPGIAPGARGFPVRRGRGRALLAALALLLIGGAGDARADLKICNRMSYVVEAAIGIDTPGATATRGWFRIDPAQCRAVVQGTLQADRILLHARALPVYGASPEPQDGPDNLCVAAGDFVIAAARQCRAGQTAARFTAIKPSTAEDGSEVAYLAEDSEYDDEQAKLAAIQRLLLIAGYDVAPIDGVDGPKTQGAMTAFFRSRNLPADVVNTPDFFTTMIKAVETPSGDGLTWCNDTRNRVMAAIATGDDKTVTSRGWYRIEPGKCLHPDIAGTPKQIYSFAEAVDANGRAISVGGKPLHWGGATILCTRDSKFEINDHSECRNRGFTPTGFTAVAPRGGQTIRFAMP